MVTLVPLHSWQSGPKCCPQPGTLAPLSPCIASSNSRDLLAQKNPVSVVGFAVCSPRRWLSWSQGTVHPTAPSLVGSDPTCLLHPSPRGPLMDGKATQPRWGDCVWVRPLCWQHLPGADARRVRVQPRCFRPTLNIWDAAVGVGFDWGGRAWRSWGGGGASCRVLSHPRSGLARVNPALNRAGLHPPP